MGSWAGYAGLAAAAETGGGGAWAGVALPDFGHPVVPAARVPQPDPRRCPRPGCADCSRHLGQVWTSSAARRRWGDCSRPSPGAGSIRRTRATMLCHLARVDRAATMLKAASLAWVPAARPGGRFGGNHQHRRARAHLAPRITAPEAGRNPLLTQSLQPGTRTPPRDCGRDAAIQAREGQATATTMPCRLAPLPGARPLPPITARRNLAGPAPRQSSR